MDDVPDQTVPSVIADEASSGSKARTAAIGLACLNWIKAAAVPSRGAPLKRYGPLAALTAGLFGLSCLGWSNIQRPAPTLPRAEINLPAQKTAEESRAQRAKVEAMRAAQSLKTAEVSAPERRNRVLRRRRTKPVLALWRPRARPLPCRPNPSRSLLTEAKGSIELD